MAIPKYRSGQLVNVRPTDKDPGGYGRITKGMWSEEDGYQEEGVRVLMLCGRDDPESADGPNFDQLMAQLEDERTNKAAQRYLRDLRNDAYIEYN